MKRESSGHIKSLSIDIMYFQSHQSSFCLRFWRISYFCGNNGPSPNVIFSVLHFEHSLLNWRLKFKEITECLQNCRFYRKITSKYSSEVKWKLINKFVISENFSAHDLRWENVIFWGCAAWSYNCLQNVDNLLKNRRNIAQFIM